MKKFTAAVIFLFGCWFNVMAADANNGIIYDTVGLALKALKSDSSAIFSMHEDWTVVTQSDPGKYVLWSFTPTSHSAHPSAIRREVIETDGQIHLEMDVLCQAGKEDCDRLVEEFEELNKKIIPKE